jgi:hypothetical protein
MKKIVTESVSEIKLNSLDGHEIVAYQCKSSSNVAILARLGTSGEVRAGMIQNKFGFVPLGDSQGKPRYFGGSFYDSIENAMVCREVYIFDNTIELCKWVVRLKDGGIY